MTRWQDAEGVIAAEVAGGEKLLWAGRPRQGPILRASDALLIPFSLMWGGFAIRWEYMVIAGGAPFFFMIWGVPFVLVGLYLIFGRFVADAMRRERTFYGVTDQRIIIVSGLVSRKVKSLNLRTLTDLSLPEGRDRGGTIAFGPAHPWAWWWGDVSWPGAPQSAPRFEMVPNARDVYELIRQAQGKT